MKRIFLIVLDSCGIGEEPDAAEFGDVGSNTLRACAASPEFDMRNLISYGLGNLDGVDYLPKAAQPKAALARLQERSRGKDTTIGHWEIAGIVSEQPAAHVSERLPRGRARVRSANRRAAASSATSPIPAPRSSRITARST